MASLSVGKKRRKLGTQITTKGTEQCFNQCTCRKIPAAVHLLKKGVVAELLHLSILTLRFFLEQKGLGTKMS